MSQYKFLIVSDLHVGKGEEYNSSTRLTIETPDIPIHDNPFESLKEFIKERGIVFDGIFNLGDLSNKGLVSGLNMGYRLLRELSIICSCPLISTPGNHDYCYGYTDGAKNLLRRIINYPTNDEKVNDEFWSKGYCLYTINDILILNCNSSKDLNSLDDNGKTPVFDNLFVDGLKRDLDKINHAGPKIAVVHHHVLQHSDIVGKYDSNDTIDHADSFLKLLKDANFNCVLHGHKHISRYSEHEGMAIMACGSLSAIENLRISDEPNYFHVLTLDFNGNTTKGKIDSFYYKLHKGWLDIVDENFSLNPRYAFGDNCDIKVLAQKLINDIPGEAPVLELEKVKHKYPELEFISNKEIDILRNELSIHGVTFYQTPQGGILFKK